MSFLRSVQLVLTLHCRESSQLAFGLTRPPLEPSRTACRASLHLMVCSVPALAQPAHVFDRSVAPPRLKYVACLAKFIGYAICRCPSADRRRPAGTVAHRWLAPDGGEPEESSASAHRATGVQLQYVAKATLRQSDSHATFAKRKATLLSIRWEAKAMRCSSPVHAEHRRPPAAEQTQHGKHQRARFGYRLRNGN